MEAAISASMSWFWALFLFAACGLAGWLGTGVILRILERRTVLDLPNERSSHAMPIPRGAGIAVIAVIVLAWLLASRASPLAPPVDWSILGCLLALSALSFLDDLRGLPQLWRLGAHAVAVAVGISTFADGTLFFHGLLPGTADHVLAGAVWIWFVNLYNFMDGIDGISGVETIAIGAGLSLVAALGAAPVVIGYAGAIAAGAAAGFLFWNWAPARIFLGDVGSIGLGYLLGWLLLSLAAAGHWAAALILPAYYLADATVTLLRRAFNGEKIWRAHHGHYYQRAARALASHRIVSGWIAAANMILLALAAISVVFAVEIAALLAAGVVSAMLLWYFATVEPRVGNDR